MHYDGGFGHYTKPRHRYVVAEADARTDGMIALYPRPDFAQLLAVPGGEDEFDLHLTLVYLDDVSSGLGGLGSLVGRLADSFGEITARIFGHAVFNPDGSEGRTPCGVYLVGHSPDLEQIYQEAQEGAQAAFPLSDQHVPWVPHITAAYDRGEGAQVGEYIGDVIFDRLGLAAGGHTQYYPFTSPAPVKVSAYRSPYLYL